MTLRDEVVARPRKGARVRDANGEPRIGIVYLGQYGGSRLVRERLRSYGRPSGLICDRENLRLVKDAGYDIVPERDNKSVWSIKDILAPMLKFGNGVPVDLVRRICALENGRACPRCEAGVYKGRSDLPECQVASIAREFVGGSSRGIHSAKFDEEKYHWAVNSVMRLIGGNGEVDPWSIDRVLKDAVHPTSHAGAPYFVRNDEVDVNVLIRECHDIVVNGKALPPFTVTSRTQHGETAPKGRLVWAAGLATTVLASRYSKPVYRAIERKYCLAFGDSYPEIGSKLVSMHTRKRFVYGFDFSAFDASLSARLIDSAFGIIKSHLRLNADDEQLFDRLVSDFIHSRLILPDGSMWQVHRGVPSGSAFTSLVDSVANLIILQYIWISRTGHPLKEREVCVLGDDSVVASSWYLDLNQVEETAQELGMVLSIPKSARVGRGGMVPFLGHGWRLGRAHRDKWELAIRLAFTEKWNKYLNDPRYSLLRRISYMADCVEGYELFFDLKSQTNRDIERDILSEVFSVNLPSLIPLLSNKERSGALTGRMEFLSRVEGNVRVPTSGIPLRLIHFGRSA